MRAQGPAAQLQRPRPFDAAEEYAALLAVLGVDGGPGSGGPAAAAAAGQPEPYQHLLSREARVLDSVDRLVAEREARARGLKGWVRNRSDGSVEAVFAGEEEEVQSMIVACHRGPRMSAVRAVRTADHPEGDWKAFEVWPTV